MPLNFNVHDNATYQKERTMPSTKTKPACAECNYLGFVIIGTDTDLAGDGPQTVQACDCGHFASDEDASNALDAFIVKHRPLSPLADLKGALVNLRRDLSLARGKPAADSGPFRDHLTNAAFHLSEAARMVDRAERNGEDQV